MEVEIFNPDNKSVEELPVIYGFANGGTPGLLMAQLIAEDGTALGSHGCSSEGFMPGDLGILKGYREDRHKNDFQKHYPKGYRMEFVSSADVSTHEGLNNAFEYNKKQKDESGN